MTKKTGVFLMVHDGYGLVGQTSVNCKLQVHFIEHLARDKPVIFVIKEPETTIQDPESQRFVI